ncbi:MAG: hypothetical protein ACOCVJ_02565 [Verrucomicrobiota bacterium]
MLITRKTKVPLIWAFYAQLILILTVYGSIVVNAPFLYLIKKFIDNPAAIMGLISIEVYVTLLGGPIITWISDRIWTRFGRRIPFAATADLLKGTVLLFMPFAPNLWVLIALRWLYGIIGDLGGPTQAVIWEIVPAKQRGISSGFKKSFMDLGNLVFFFLLLGRFNDVYFLGPLSFLKDVSGATLLFWLGGILLIGTSLFEYLGVKEVYPPGRKRMSTGRKPGENVLWSFTKTIFKDVFAMDLLPLYLLLFASVMFGFSLGLFQPLLFTEQWGYDLQTFGNNVAIGVPFAVLLGLLAGWLTDKYGKIEMFLLATVGNLVVNIIYTVFVYYQPDFRPSFWEIVAFGNIANIFGSIKAVVSYPLLYEYVSRNRLGSAIAGIGIFNTAFRNAVALFMGVWLMLWSIWFFPQAGFNVSATFQDEKSKEQVVEQLERAGVDMTGVVLRPLHQYGVDGETSTRWWIHRNVGDAQESIKEREDLENEISNLNRKKNSLLTTGERKAELKAEIKDKRERIDEIEARLEAEADQLRDQIAPAFEGLRFQPGDQLIDASLAEDGRLVVVAQSIEKATEDNLEILEEKLGGPELALLPSTDTDRIGVFEPVLEVDSLTLDEIGEPAIRYEAVIDPRFRTLFAAGLDAGMTPEKSYDFGSAIIESLRGVFGRSQDAFEIASVESESVTFETETDDGEMEEEARRRFFLRVPGVEVPDAELEQFADAFRAGDATFKAAEASMENGTLLLRLDLKAPGPDTDAPESEIRRRLAGMVSDPTDQALVEVSFDKLVDVAAARPVNITIPSHAIVASYSKREYEYFFSSQIIQIATDVFGIGIVILLVVLERRGTIHRYGAEEDQNR